MSVMGPDGKILQPGGRWWSPYGNTDEEIRALFYLPKQLQVRRDKNGDIDQVMPANYKGKARQGIAKSCSEVFCRVVKGKPKQGCCA